MDNGRETFGTIVTIKAKFGMSSIYGGSDLQGIISAGCKQLGYVCRFSEVELPMKFGEHSIIMGIDIKPILNHVSYTYLCPPTRLVQFRHCSLRHLHLKPINGVLHSPPLTRRPIHWR